MFDFSLATIELGRIVSSKFLDEFNLGSNVSRDIESIKNWLGSGQEFLEDQQREVGGGQFLQKLVHEIEDIIDEFRLHERKIIRPQAELRKISSKINGIRKKLDDMGAFNNALPHGTNTNPAEGSIPAPRVENGDAHFFLVEDDIVGFEHEKEDIISQLFSGEPSRTLISLVGPPGSGKTALAKHVYESDRVRRKFDHRAWVSASHPLELKKVLRTILQYFSRGMDRNLTDMAIILKALEDFREGNYLIVLDDVWRKEECDPIINALPANFQYSRIIITSRIPDVASSCLHKHELKGLSEENAFTLFCKKAFPANNCQCPPGLEELAMNVAKKCEGLPLHLVDAGILLSSKRPIPREWENVCDRLGAKLPNLRSRILHSYKYLPSHLKFCFLYFSIFPENYSIQRERLKRLWIAEGFVNEQRNRTKEDVAEDYLNELAGMNLIHVCARDIDGRVKRCRLLNLVHQFIVSKAEEGNFFKILTKASSENSLGNARRLSVQSDTNLGNLNLNLIRSAFLLAKSAAPFPCNFRLLKVLEMEGAPLECFPTVILKLVLLTYLSLRQTKIRSVPDSIKDLERLETLDLRQTHLSCLPKETFKLRCLRHLLVSCFEVSGDVRSDGVQGVLFFSRLTCKFDSLPPKAGYLKRPVDSFIKGLFDWPDIQTLSLVKANYMLLAKLGDLTNLRKLGLVVLKKEDGRKICESIQKMEHLSTLEIMVENEEDYLELDHITGQPGFGNLQHLYLRGRLQELPMWICQLPSLIKISLKWSRLDTSPLLLLQILPNLMQLELVDAYRGNSLVFKADTLPKLKVLHIEHLRELNELIMDEEVLSKLEKLKISSCESLKSLPPGIFNLKHLKLLWDD